MKRVVLAALCLLIPSAVIAQSGGVYTRAWCANPAHGNSRSGYGWISEVFVASSNEPCWEYARGHRQQGHEKTGCSYVDPRTGEMPGK